MDAVLVDWHDYPLIVSLIWQYTQNLPSLDFSQLFYFPMFYPQANALLFSDLFLVHGFLASMLSLFSNNNILVFNILFFLTLLLNSIAAFTLWQSFFSRASTLFFATLTTALSPYFFLQLSHFQMISFWPFLFILAILLKKKVNQLELYVLASLLVIQFLTSVYLWLFAGIAIFCCLLVQVPEFWQDKKLSKWQFRKLIAILLSLILISPLLWQYSQVKKSHSVNISQEQLLVNSAQISDYLLNFLPHTLLDESRIYVFLKQLNHNQRGEAAVFPGLVLFSLGVLGFWKKRKRPYFAKASQDKKIFWFFASLVALGLIFSLGPRCQVNDWYCRVPLPYWGVIKIFPFLDTFDAIARWSFLFYLGFSYFASLGLGSLIENKKKLQQYLIISGLTMVYMAEVFPVFAFYRTVDYFTPVHEYLQSACSSSTKVILRYPLDQRNGFVVLESLQARSIDLLAASRHQCHLTNGYSGLAPVDYTQLEAELNSYFTAKNFENFLNLIKNKDTNYLQVKHDFLDKKINQNWLDWVENQEKLIQVAKDEQSTLYLLTN